MNKHISKLFNRATCALFIALFSCASSVTAFSPDESDLPATIGEIAAKHQDAILSQKYFTFSSDISLTGNNEPAYAFTATGSVNLDGWSHYIAATSGDGSVSQEYYVRDDLAFRFVSIEKDSFKPAADTSVGWELVSSEIFHRDVSINPLYIFAQLLDKTEPAAESPEESTAKGCRALKSSWSENGSNLEAGFCVAGNGLATEFTAMQNIAGPDESGDIRFMLKMTVTPLTEAETIVPPEKVHALYDEEKKKEDNKIK